MKEKYFMWSDNWWIENDIAWFVDGEHSILFKIDLETEKCEYVSKIPNEGASDFRLNPRCIKVGKDIYCLPYMGMQIWVYDIEADAYTSIAIDDINKGRLAITNFWLQNNSLLVLSRELGLIIEINTITREMERSYFLPNQVSASVKVGDSLFCVSSASDCIFEFNIKMRTCKEYKLPIQLVGLNTVSYDGNIFFLSGIRKEIYVWDRGKNSLKILNNFPDNFGIYLYEYSGEDILDCVSNQYVVPAFSVSVKVRDGVWFIPFKTNQIVYLDNHTYKISAFEIPEEAECEQSLHRNSLKHKYLLQYVVDNRYIGLFSLKNQRVLEIDTLKQTVSWKNYYIDDGCLVKIANSLNASSAYFKEGQGVDNLVYKEMVENESLNTYTVKKSVGQLIYQTLN